MVLLFFYQIGSMATKYKKTVKQQLDATAAVSAVRGATQVLACSILAVMLSLAHVYYCGREAPIDFEKTIEPIVARFWRTPFGDTLATNSISRLDLFSLRSGTVPAGTNGGTAGMLSLRSLLMGILTVVSLRAVTRVVKTTFLDCVDLSVDPGGYTRNILGP
jgi:uncharacterized membrane protein